MFRDKILCYNDFEIYMIESSDKGYYIMKEQFENACKFIVGSERARPGIGTLGEKTLHAVLKYTFEPDPCKHEIKIGNFYADIADGNTIMEIQTRNFNVLRKKLSFFLENYIVTVIHPIPRTKWIVWLDPETGEATKKRKSPKSGTICDAFYELYKIKQLLLHPNLRLCFVFLDIVEYRNLDGWSKDKKKGSSRFERIPKRLDNIVFVNSAKEYQNLIPESLSGNFTTKDFQKAAGRNLHHAQIALNVLKYVGAVTQVGKQGNAHVYERAT